MATPKEVRKRQIITFLITGALVFLVIQVFTMWIKQSKDPLQTVNNTKSFSWPNSSDLDLREYWYNQLENDNKALKADIKKSTDELAAQRKLIDDLSKKIDVNNAKTSYELFEKNKQHMQADPFVSTKTVSSSEVLSNTVVNQPFPGMGQDSKPATTQTKAPTSVEQGAQAEKRLQGIVNNKLKLNKAKNLHNADSYIPAGSFVQAHVIGGMMASAGIESQGEPRPVLLRITDLTQLPNKVVRNIKDCHVMAGGFGDVSSKRAYIRTETLSCTLNDNQIFENEVKGYLAGGDSMSGIQGQIIRNEKEMISNAFWAGLVRGGGKAFTGTLGSTSTSALGTVKNMNKKDILPGMLGEGISDSADTLQDYFIQLAKQHHPIIEVTPGQEVSIVFTEGFSFEGAVR